MRLSTILKYAAASLLSNKLRSLLTMLGLIIGIASVILLVGIGQGANQSVRQKMDTLGGDILTASVYTENPNDGLKPADLGEIKKLSGVQALAPFKVLSAKAYFEKNTSKRSVLAGTDDQYLELRNLKLQSGRNLSIIDLEERSKVCVIGANIAFDLFHTTQVKGNSLKLGGDEYKIVGILEPQGESLGVNADNLILVPLTTSRYFDLGDDVGSFYVKAESQEQINGVKSALSAYLTIKKGLSPAMYSVSSQDEMLNAGADISGSLSQLLAGIAGISLIVGGIGVMNVMLVSVSERVREIGIRKALGTKRRDILAQFLAEALAMSLLGGAFGVGAGIAAGFLSTLLGFQFVIPAVMVPVAFGASTLIGLAFGIFPACRASNLNPIEALRR
ncbi:ABC transporter permease [Eubacterium maltosivorans]|uniref:ABC transporter permease n=1 Tax=Eubacterium maltosivorans TaxID=2041044 RepID=UPI00189EC970|nr:ABC transporter permease [Eubacterium maltosivorans]